MVITDKFDDFQLYKGKKGQEHARMKWEGGWKVNGRVVGVDPNPSIDVTNLT
jgi:hypothetical protein